MSKPGPGRRLPGMEASWRPIAQDLPVVPNAARACYLQIRREVGGPRPWTSFHFHNRGRGLADRLGSQADSVNTLPDRAF